MKKLLVLAAIIAAAWWWWNGRAPQLAPEKAAEAGNTVERYAQRLADSPKKAEAAREKMNAAIKETQKTAEKALEEAGAR